MKSKTAIIVGGGIGGLTSALCLIKIGWKVQILEQAPEISEIGAGLQISANGYKVLDALGVMAEIDKDVFHPESIQMRMGQSGKVIFNLPMKGLSVQRWGAPYVQVHRVDLIAGLLSALNKLQPDAVQVNSKVISYAQDDTGIMVNLHDGSTHKADILIGADGIHSVVREQMLGKDQPRFTGNIAWRAIVPIEKLGNDLPPPSGCVWQGKQRHAVTSRIRAGKVINFVGIIERDTPEPEGWKTRVIKIKH